MRLRLFKYLEERRFVVNFGNENRKYAVPAKKVKSNKQQLFSHVKAIVTNYTSTVVIALVTIQ